MADDFVTTERDDNGVVLVQLNRPPMNPLSQAMLGALRDVGHELAADATREGGRRDRQRPRVRGRRRHRRVR